MRTLAHGREAAYVCPVTGHHTSPFRRGVQKGGPSVFEMPSQPYTKPHATPLQRVQHLQAKGLLIPDPNRAAGEIELIGYERLRIYFLSQRQLTAPGKPFLLGTSYQDILDLYECDVELRDVCFSSVGRFEVLFRNSLSEALSRSYGSHPYFNVAAFADATANLKAIQSFIAVYSKSKDPRATHYAANYSDPILPPIWTMKEFLTFGASSRIYQCLSGQIKTLIASDFGVGSDKIFINWIECLVDLRNICAHHDRLFNRSFQKQPGKLISAGLPTAPRNKLKAILECLDHVLGSRGLPVNVTSKVDAILKRYPKVRPVDVGF
jgi:abortive infection bacteriophage resistance protein